MIREGTIVRLIDGRCGVVGMCRPSPNPQRPQYEIYFKPNTRLVTSEIAEVLAVPPETWPRGEGAGLYASIVEYVASTDSRVSAVR